MQKTFWKLYTVFMASIVALSIASTIFFVLGHPGYIQEGEYAIRIGILSIAIIGLLGFSWNKLFGKLYSFFQ